MSSQSGYRHQETADRIITQLYHEIPASSQFTKADRLHYLSGYFLGRPYLLGALGEGPLGQFDQNPLYRTDAFDCLTYVNTVLALFFSKNLAEFKEKIIAVNYLKGKIAYQNRHHFMSIDWNPENERLGIIFDVTRKIMGTDGRSIAKISETEIDRPNWFLHRQLSDIKISPALSLEEQQQRLLELRSLSNQMTVETSHLPYLPLAELFDTHGHFNRDLMRQIPDSSIIEIVRPQWNLREKIGTFIDISHLGFALWKKNILIFRHASLIKNRVIEIPLIDYLQPFLKHATIKGINIHKIEMDIFQ